MIRQIQSGESVSEAVVEAVSATEDCPPTSLPPLYNVINPESLNMIFKVTKNSEPDYVGHITFRYSDSVVTIGENGYLTVQESLKLLDGEEI